MRALLTGFAIAALSGSIARGEDLFADYRTLVPQEGFAATGQKLAIGHLEFELAEGAIWPLANGTGTTVGYVFEGKGRWIYRTEDPSDVQTFAQNLNLQIPALKHSDTSVYDELLRAWVMISQPFSAEQLGSTKAGPISASARDWFERRAAQADDDGSGISHALAQAYVNQDSRLTARVEVDGDVASLGYSLFSAQDARERLWKFVQEPGLHYRTGRTVSTQRPASAERVITAPYLVTHIGWNVDTPDNRRGTIATTLDLKIQKPNQRVLGFELMNHRDNAPTSTWTSTKNQLIVRAVRDASGRELLYSHRYGELYVDLGGAPAVNSSVALQVDTDADIFTALNNERGQNYIALYGSGWYPSPLGWSSERFTFDLTASCKAPFYPVSSGETVSVSEQGGKNVMVAKSTVPVDDFALFMGKYTPFELTSERGQLIRVHGYGLVDKRGLEQIAQFASVFLRMFEDHLGPYPFKELDLLEIPTFYPFGYFGVSPAGLVFLGDSATRSTGYDSYSDTRELPALLAHEIAHQWWGHKVWPASEYDNWLTESLAEYQAGIALQYAKVDGQVAYGKPVKGWRSIREGWIGYSRWCEADASIEAANKMRGANSSRLRRCLLYERGPLVVHMLRSWVGDKGYFAILQRLIKDHEYSPVTTDDFAKAASQVLNQDMQWFVDDWIKQPGTPEIRVEATVGSDAAGNPVLNCKSVQTDPKLAKRLYIPIMLTYSGGKTEAKMFFVKGAVAEQSFPLVTAPTKIEVDPTRTALVKYK